MKPRPSKPAKPYEEFPLFPHASGQWAKTILGKQRYFGKWNDWQAAYAKFKAQREYLYGGKEPPPDESDATTVAQVLNAFYKSKQRALELSNLTQRSFDDYEAVCDTIAATLGKDRPIESVSSDDLSRLRSVLATGTSGKPRSPVSLKRFVGIARMVFNFANEEYEPALSRQIRYRKSLSQPAAKELRKARNKVGERMFTADEIRGLLDIAKPQLKAMIYLGINCGFGNNDCASLPIEQVNIQRGWHTYWRPKTQIARRCPLWPETAAALYAVIKERTDGLVFITKYGNSWDQGTRCCPISYEFRKLAMKLKVHRKGITTFYSLRRTFETIGATAGEQHAVDFIMGHTPAANDMAAIYRQKTFNSSLLKVTEHVRNWLHGSVSIR